MEFVPVTAGTIGYVPTTLEAVAVVLKVSLKVSPFTAPVTVPVKDGLAAPNIRVAFVAEIAKGALFTISTTVLVAD